VPEGFVQHTPFYHLARQLETESREHRRILLTYWARVCGLTIVQLKQQLKAAQ
jgi:hypothetical protein